MKPRLIWDIQERQHALNDPQLAEHYRCVVVAGGDGSIQAVVNELAQAGRLDVASPGPVVPVAALPMGNENLFARHFGFTRDTRRLAMAIASGRTRTVDLGRISQIANDSSSLLFTLMVGVGFDAEVVHRVDQWRRGGGRPDAGLRRVRRISYAPKILSTFLAYPYPSVRIEVAGRTFTGSHLFVFNLPRYGGRLKLAPPGCTPDDGLLDWVLFEKPGRAAMLATAARALIGRALGRPGVRQGKARLLTIHGPDPDVNLTRTGAPAVQVDGDPAGHTPVEVGIDTRRRLELLIT